MGVMRVGAVLRLAKRVGEDIEKFDVARTSEKPN